MLVRENLNIWMSIWKKTHAVTQAQSRAFRDFLSYFIMHRTCSPTSDHVLYIPL